MSISVSLGANICRCILLSGCNRCKLTVYSVYVSNLKEKSHTYTLPYIPLCTARQEYLCSVNWNRHSVPQYVHSVDKLWTWLVRIVSTIKVFHIFYVHCDTFRLKKNVTYCVQIYINTVNTVFTLPTLYFSYCVQCEHDLRPLCVAYTLCFSLF